MLKTTNQDPEEDGNVSDMDETSNLNKKNIINTTHGAPLPQVPKANPQGQRVPNSRLPPKDKKEVRYSEYVRLEKMRNFQRLPRLVGERNSVPFVCPSCKREGQTNTNYELTG